jgi:hypothetical protein
MTHPRIERGSRKNISSWLLLSHNPRTRPTPQVFIPLRLTLGWTASPLSPPRKKCSDRSPMTRPRIEWGLLPQGSDFYLLLYQTRSRSTLRVFTPLSFTCVWTHKYCGNTGEKTMRIQRIPRVKQGFRNNLPASCPPYKARTYPAPQVAISVTSGRTKYLSS